ncbi:tripartite tricarboxylate transporter TctB family protein [Azospirillum brasilense]|uniref:tripartite tricarboxylate transporter TctB family protein n=1 Tax=Azospirillum brasilense TaxID=192 RepID=UPI00190C5989|nr:tripartite tricarboxylate transporter TctB family protein [Azospirillum brasilense]MBK3736796.1 tripartite tricarboxylate transporter TctB family protein [Azospirillum brasilense]
MPSLPFPNLRPSSSVATPPRGPSATPFGTAPAASRNAAADERTPLRIPGRASQDLAAGLLITSFGLIALWMGRDWPTGTLAYVQSGFFPRMIGALMVLAGAVVTGRSLLAHGAALPSWGWRPLFGVTAAVLAFAGTVETLGLVPAVLILVGGGNLAGQPLRPVPLALLGGALAAGCVALFVWGLGLPLQVWPLGVWP